MALQPQNPRVNFQSTLAPHQDTLAPQSASVVPQTAGLVPQQNPSLVPQQNSSLVPQSTALVPQSAPAPQSALVPQTTAPATVLGRGGDNYPGRGGDNYLGRGGDSYRTTPASSQLGRDHNTLTDQIRMTNRWHERPIDVPSLSVKHVLQTITAILARYNKPAYIHGTAVPGVLVPATAHVDTLEHEKAIHASLSSLHDTIDVPTSILNEIFCEILKKSLTRVDASKITMDVLERVQYYDWDEKVVLALASFAINDGKFWLVAECFTTNALAKAIGQLKQTKEILEQSGTSSKPKFEPYNNLVRAVLKVTKIIVRLQEFHRDPHLIVETKAICPTTHISTAVYWTVQGIVILTSRYLRFSGFKPEYVTEERELTLARNLENIYNRLEEKLNRFVPQQNPSLVPQSTALVFQSDPVPQTRAPATVISRGGDSYRTTPASFQLGRDRRQYSASSDHDTLTDKILMTNRWHDDPFNVPSLSVKDILQTITAILARDNKTADIHGTAVPGVLVPATAHVDTLEHEKAIHASLSSLHDTIDVPTSILNEIFCEILKKSLTRVDASKITMDVLERVQYYDWDEKVVLALASFAINDGKFWLVAECFTTNALAKAIGQLKQTKEILEQSGTSLKPKFEAYNNLVRAVLKVTKIIVHFQEFHPDTRLTIETKTIRPANPIPTAVYWTVWSIVILVSQLLGITGSNPGYVTEAGELSSLAHKLENIHNGLEKNLASHSQLIQKLRDEDAFNAIARILQSPHIDNSKPLGVLFYKDNQPALYDGYNKKRVNIDVLRRKVVILMVSDLDIVQENDYLIAHQMYLEKRQFPQRPESQYEIVWVPIVDNWTEAKQLQFEELRNGMEWYSVYHPSVVSPNVVKYIRHPKKWNFVKKPLLVVMDPQGKIVHINAVHMMCVFGSAAYPFTRNRERLLWEEETWRIELLVDAIDQTLLNWISESKYICLYGGEDINWIRSFTRAAKEVALDAGIDLELLYLGKSKQKERVSRDIIRIIKEERLSHTVDWNLIWFFWVRLESMWQSFGQFMIELSRANVRDNRGNDTIMQGIFSLLKFGSSNQGWALSGFPSAAMSTGNGNHMLKSMIDYKTWKIRHNEIGFTSALNEYLLQIPPPPSVERRRWRESWVCCWKKKTERS